MTLKESPNYFPISLGEAVVAIRHRLNRRNRRFARRIEKRKRYDFCGYCMSHGFDRHLHLQGRADRRLVAIHARQRDHLLQCRRPRSRRRLPHVFSVVVDGHRHTRRDARHLRRHPDFVVQGFHFVPVDFQSNQRALRSAVFLFPQQCVTPDEIFFFQVYKFSEPDFSRRKFARQSMLSCWKYSPLQSGSIRPRSLRYPARSFPRGECRTLSLYSPARPKLLSRLSTASRFRNPDRPYSPSGKYLPALPRSVRASRENISGWKCPRR